MWRKKIIKREKWNKKIKEYKLIDRQSPDAKSMLDKKFGEICQILYEELTDYEKNLANEIIKSINLTQDVKKVDREYIEFFMKTEKFLYASRLQKLWRKLFEKYRYIPNTQYSLRASDYLKHLKIHPTKEYKLDIGCREGNVSKIFDDALGKVIGIDIDIPNVREKAVQLVNGDGCNLPFSDNSFGLILCVNVIEHVSDPQLLIKECERCLKEDGVLYLVYPNKYFLVEPHTGIPFITYLPKSAQDIISLWLVGYKLESYPINGFYSMNELHMLLSKYQFKIIDSKKLILGEYIFPGIFILIHKFFKFIRFYEICPPSLYVICKKRSTDLHNNQ